MTHEQQTVVVPPGWTLAAYLAYLGDPDGGRSPVRLRPTAAIPPSVAEVLSAWES